VNSRIYMTHKVRCAVCENNRVLSRRLKLSVLSVGSRSRRSSHSEQLGRCNSWCYFVQCWNWPKRTGGGSAAGMFEILPRDWNLKLIFTQKMGVCRHELGGSTPNPPPTISTLILWCYFDTRAAENRHLKHDVDRTTRSRDIVSWNFQDGGLVQLGSRFIRSAVPKILTRIIIDVIRSGSTIREDQKIIKEHRRKL